MATDFDVKLEKTDLTEYGSSELSLYVFNDEWLYARRHRGDFEKFLRQMFVFTDEQWDELVEDLMQDAMRGEPESDDD
tara:strand:- start:277 stop:510 length:234 start_codon:yes stop_codon:yes gene_type:complete